MFPHLLIQVHGFPGPSIHLNASPEPLARINKKIKNRGKSFIDPWSRTEAGSKQRFQLQQYSTHSTENYSSLTTTHSLITFFISWRGNLLLIPFPNRTDRGGAETLSTQNKFWSHECLVFCLRGFIISLSSSLYLPVAKTSQLWFINIWNYHQKTSCQFWCLPPVWPQKVFWREKMAAPSQNSPPRPCVCISHLQPQDNCHLRQSKFGKWLYILHTESSL